MIELAQINSPRTFRWIELAKNQAAMGKIWSHIPTLAAADPNGLLFIFVLGQEKVIAKEI